MPQITFLPARLGEAGARDFLAGLRHLATLHRRHDRGRAPLRCRRLSSVIFAGLAALHSPETAESARSCTWWSWWPSLRLLIVLLLVLILSGTTAAAPIAFLEKRLRALAAAPSHHRC